MFQVDMQHDIVKMKKKTRLDPNREIFTTQFLLSLWVVISPAFFASYLRDRRVLKDWGSHSRPDHARQSQCLPYCLRTGPRVQNLRLSVNPLTHRRAAKWSQTRKLNFSVNSGDLGRNIYQYSARHLTCLGF